jgi:hypothetical protein
MSGFDVMARSQESVQQSQQFYDSQRYQGQQQMVNTLGGVGQQFIQTQRDQAMLGMEQGRMQRELQMQEAETAARLTSIQQQQQLDQYKLQMMAAMDQADMGQAQVESAKLQNKLLAAQVAREEYAVNNLTKSSRTEEMAGIARMFEAAPEMWAQGMIFDPEKGVITDEERAKQASSTYKPRSSTGTTEFNAQRNYLNQLYKAAEAQGDQPTMDRVYKQLQGMGGEQQPEGAPQAKGPQQAKFSFDPELRAQQAAMFQQAFAQAGEGPLRSVASADPATQQAIAEGLSVLGEQLVKIRGIDPSAVHRYVLKQAETDPLPLMFALRSADYSENRIKAWLLSQGKTEAQVNSLMTAHRREIEELMRPVRQ